MTMSRSLTRIDIDVLRSIRGDSVPGLAWGAAMSISVEFLDGLGLVSREVKQGAVHYVLTKEGKEWLARHDAAGRGP